MLSSVDECIAKLTNCVGAATFQAQAPGCGPCFAPNQARWMRKKQFEEPYPELPDLYVQQTEINRETGRSENIAMLLLTGDQEAAGRRCGSGFSTPADLGGLGLLCDFQAHTGEDFHRSWNDFQWSCQHAVGHHMATQAQVSIFYFTPIAVL